MLLLKIVLISFLLLKCGYSSTPELIHRYTCLRTLLNPFLREIVLQNEDTSFTGKICSFHSSIDDKINQPKIGQTHGLNMVTNCEFAYWTITKIYGLINQSLLFHPQEHIFSKNDSEFNQEFENNVETFLINVDTKIKNFIRLLAIIIQLTMDVSVQNNAYALMPLLSLLIKSYYITLTKKNDTNTHYSMSKADILRLILIEMFELQRFYLMNCQEEPNKNSNFQLYDTWVPIKIDENVANQNVDNLLIMVKDIGIEIIHNQFEDYCYEIENILSIINISKDEDRFKEFADVKIETTKNIYLSIRDIVKQVQINYDINVLHRIHKTILIAIMKLIFSKIIFLINKKADLHDVRKTILEAKEILKRNYTPSYIKNGFEVLSEIKIKGTPPKVRNKLNKYFASFEKIEIYESSSITIVLPKIDSQISEIKLLKSINVLIQIITDNKDNYACFYDFFKHVQNSYNAYYKPLVNSKKYLILKFDTKNQPEKCLFIKNILILGNYAFTESNKYVRTLASEENAKYFNNLNNTLKNIKHYFLLIVQRSIEDMDILTMAYEISAILVNFTLNSDDEWLQFKAKRVLNLIINEMNMYGIKYCSSTNTNFWSLNNNRVCIDNNDNIETVNESIKNFLECNLKNNIFCHFIHSEECIEHYFSIQYFHQTFVKYSSYIRSYEENIKILWNGSLHNLDEVFLNASKIVFNPLTVFALYDTFFKFNAAVLYFWISEILSTGNLEDIKKIFLAMYVKYRNWQRLFPPTLKDIMNKIMSILKNYPKDHTSIDDAKQKGSDLQPIFGSFNIFFKTENSLSYEKTEFKLKIYSEIFLDDMYRNLTKVFGYYLKITRYQPSVSKSGKDIAYEELKKIDYSLYIWKIDKLYDQPLS